MILITVGFSLEEQNPYFYTDAPRLMLCFGLFTALIKTSNYKSLTF